MCYCFVDVPDYLYRNDIVKKFRSVFLIGSLFDTLAEYFNSPVATVYLYVVFTETFCNHGQEFFRTVLVYEQTFYGDTYVLPLSAISTAISKSAESSTYT